MSIKHVPVALKRQTLVAVLTSVKMTIFPMLDAKVSFPIKEKEDFN